MINHKQFKRFATVAALAAFPVLCNGVLIFQYDFNDTAGATTLDSQFPDTPPITGTQKSANPNEVTFSADVPNVHPGGFSGDHFKGGGSNEVALRFVLPSTTANIGSSTLTAWLKPDALATGTLTYFQTGSTFRVQRLNDSTIRYRYGGTNIDGTAATPLDTWTFVAITYDDITGDTTFYTRAEGAPSFTTNITTSSTGLTSGGGVNIFTSHSAQVSQGWDGLQDNIRFYDHALTAGELQSVYSYSDVIVPEPSSYAAIFGLLVTGIVFLRRKKIDR